MKYWTYSSHVIWTARPAVLHLELVSWTGLRSLRNAIEPYFIRFGNWERSEVWIGSELVEQVVEDDICFSRSLLRDTKKDSIQVVFTLTLIELSMFDQAQWFISYSGYSSSFTMMSADSIEGTKCTILQLPKSCMSTAATHLITTNAASDSVFEPPWWDSTYLLFALSICLRHILIRISLFFLSLPSFHNLTSSNSCQFHRSRLTLLERTIISLHASNSLSSSALAWDSENELSWAELERFKSFFFWILSKHDIVPSMMQEINDLTLFTGLEHPCVNLWLYHIKWGTGQDRIGVQMRRILFFLCFLSLWAPSVFDFCSSQAPRSE